METERFNELIERMKEKFAHVYTTPEYVNPTQYIFEGTDDTEVGLELTDNGNISICHVVYNTKYENNFCEYSTGLMRSNDSITCNNIEITDDGIIASIGDFEIARFNLTLRTECYDNYLRTYKKLHDICNNGFPTDVYRDSCGHKIYIRYVEESLDDKDCILVYIDNVHIYCHDIEIFAGVRTSKRDVEHCLVLKDKSGAVIARFGILADTCYNTFGEKLL